MRYSDMESWSNLCRCCLSPSSEVSLLNNEQSVKHKFLEITTIEVKDDDGLPQKLCEECYTILNTAYQFRIQCLKMDKEFKLQLESVLKQSLSQFSQIETQVKANEDMTIEDIAQESMKQLESIIKSEPSDDEDYYYVLVIDNPDDKESSSKVDTNKIKVETNPEKETVLPNIKQEAVADIALNHNDENNTDNSQSKFENCVDSFLVTNPRVPINVPATILENEEGQENDNQYESMEVDMNQIQEPLTIVDKQGLAIVNNNLAVFSDDQDKSLDEYPLEITGELINDIPNKNFIKILTPSGEERTILLKSNETVKYLTESDLSKEDAEAFEQQEVYYCDDDTSQFQILKCDGSDIVIEYADGSEIATILQQEDGTFLCDCGEQFEDLAEYEKHQYKHNPAGEHLCNLCGKGFETMEILTGHMLLHSVTGPLVNCPFCNQLIKRNTLTQHIKYVHNNKPKCNLCSKTFANQNNLKRHMMIHSGIRDFECDVCQKRFGQKITMQTHRLTHLNPFVCSQCSLQFENKEALMTHKENKECNASKVIKAKEELMKTVKQAVTTNLGKLLGYACSLCKKMFSLESALEQHVENTHIVEAMSTDQDKNKKPMKRFECSICAKGCASQAMLIMHERVHTNERPFPCQLCSLRFKTKTHLRTHQLTHTREKKFGCSVCLKFFALKGNLVVHLRTHTGERPYVCSLCNEAFIDSKYLKKHKLKRHAIENLPWNQY